MWSLRPSCRVLWCRFSCGLSFCVVWFRASWDTLWTREFDHHHRAMDGVRTRRYIRANMRCNYPSAQITRRIWPYNAPSTCGYAVGEYRASATPSHEKPASVHAREQRPGGLTAAIVHEKTPPGSLRCRSRAGYMQGVVPCRQEGLLFSGSSKLCRASREAVRSLCVPPADEEVDAPPVGHARHCRGHYTPKTQKRPTPRRARVCCVVVRYGYMGDSPISAAHPNTR